MRFFTHFLIALTLSSKALAWGDLGHRTVALLAQKYITPDTQQLLDSILQNDQDFDFSDAATWADTIKRQRPQTKEWHYIDAQDSPPKQCGLHYPKDCTDQGKDGCIITAITDQTALFLDPSTDPTIRKEALMFIMHFIGDIHQPLHVEDAYRGGNEIRVCFAHACANNNLHSVWDKYIPHKIVGIKNTASHHEEKTAGAAWAEKLFNLNSKREGGVEVKDECADITDPAGCTLAWTREANTWVCKYVMKESVEWLEGNDLSQAYFKNAVPVVEELIGKAGARLGAWLNALAAGAPQNVLAEAGLARGEL
ncbi:S1/P1 nuclease [Acephala macrosclerotiorum]|nr:S1/P1 nuclease [Acephala macrosclerotiorum]